MSESSLRINEIFYSLQGETSTSGIPTVFVRLTGCPLRCSYCDTEYAFYEGERRALGDILQELEGYEIPYITVTGGEPLAQPDCLVLLKELCDRDYRVSLETSGALSIAEVDPRVHIILDLKTPSSGEVNKNLWDNVPLLGSKDEIKFVVCDQSDYQWVRMSIDRFALLKTGAEILLSPAQGTLQPDRLASWVLEDKLPVRMQIQLHKYLWGDARSR